MIYIFNSSEWFNHAPVFVEEAFALVGYAYELSSDFGFQASYHLDLQWFISKYSISEAQRRQSILGCMWVRVDNLVHKGCNTAENYLFVLFLLYAQCVSDKIR